MSRGLVLLISILGVIFLAGCFFLSQGFGTWSGFGLAISSTSAPATLTPHVVRPASTSTPFSLPAADSQVLEDTLIPINDLLDLARRLQGRQDIPLTQSPPPAPRLEVGHRKNFWVTDTDTNENFTVEAVLRYVTAHSYFWIQEGVTYRPRDLAALAETFEAKIYPTTRAFFGSEPTPGVDGDPHLYILYTGQVGSSVAGYFSASGTYPPQAHPYSNAHELFVLNADQVELGQEYTYSILAHEFQHMIHWSVDRNEDLWLNEGFSELAAFLNGYNPGRAARLYAADPDIQLNDWPVAHSERLAHYGSSFLFVKYFLDRFGEEITRALVAHPENGLKSIAAIMEQHGIRDAQNGKPVSAEDIFLDWVLASYVQDQAVGDGRYTYRDLRRAPQPEETEHFRTCPAEPQTRQVSQYGVDYIRITCSGSYTLRFEGSTQVPVLPASPYSGSYAFWSNRGDESNMTLTRLFDFRAHSGPLTFTYQAWYDLEKDYDYLYLVASLDGKSWQILTTPSGTSHNPTGNSFGWAYNGQSGASDVTRPEWIQERVDISTFAGQQVYLRFEYVTDAGVNGEGFLLDDVAIPEIGYFADFESGEAGWQPGGFARIQNILPQSFRLALIRTGQDTTVSTLTLDPHNSLDLPLEIGADVDELVLVVSGTTRFTRQKAAYRFHFEP